ncbi:MAG: DUF1080 domain-containing protein [Fermentimonas sp.]|jgi:hypothetical protein|nr:DUF1080 domain-containing protein [Fermentimonas sp.]MBP6196848.1 DUF1080 domain-containing protein [Fermentimonas sp.]MBP7104836.1 DUF1080 domain-containing protein [Fermentimonas sp.]
MKLLNLYAAFLFLAIFLTACTQKSNEIFNGKDLSNWEFVVENNAVHAEEVFSLNDGIIKIKGEPFGYMYTKEKYADFTLDLEYRWIGEATNSGVFFLIEETNNPFPKGVECQLMAGKAGDLVLLSGADLNEYVLPEGVEERPAFPVIEKQNPSSENATGEWNKVQITVKDGNITVKVNGVLQNIASSNVKEGHIGLQSEGKAIEFRNLVIS